jgi:hypothetical protein
MVMEFDDSLTQIERSFGDAGYLALLKRRWEATAWKPDDPRVMEVAYVWSEEYAKQSNPSERAANRDDAAVRLCARRCDSKRHG